MKKTKKSASNDLVYAAVVREIAILLKKTGKEILASGPACDLIRQAFKEIAQITAAHSKIDLKAVVTQNRKIKMAELDCVMRSVLAAGKKAGISTPVLSGLYMLTKTYLKNKNGRNY
ncbi:MAG: hypothetical protein HY747_07980 [Elusimicrobia bacterium]|nr:hypothetical protein [Elusimicrobiota bacterium]